MLKKAVIFLLTVAALYAEVAWQPDYESALEKARLEKKPLLVLMVSHTCRWCRRLENRTLEHPAVRDYVDDHFVAVKVYREEEAYPETLHASLVPTTFFLAPDGEPLPFVVEGYEDPSDYLDSLKAAWEAFEKDAR